MPSNGELGADSRTSASHPLRATQQAQGDAALSGVEPGNVMSMWGQNLMQLKQFAIRCRLPILLVFHLAVFSVVFLLSYAIRYDGAIPERLWPRVLSLVPAVIAIKLLTFAFFKSHQGWWRYTTFADIVHLGYAVTAASIGVVLVGYLIDPQNLVPRSVVLIDWAMTLLFLGALRGGTRLLREQYYPMTSQQPSQPVLIVGVSELGLALVHELRVQPRLGLKPVGFLDPNPNLKGRVLAGLPVLGVPGDLDRVVERSGARTVLVPTPAIEPAELRDLVARCKEANVRLKVVPGVDAFISGRVVVQPRDVEIEDLLARDPVNLDSNAIGRFLTDRVVLITGAAGSIGSEICRQVLAFRPSRLLLLDHSENGLFFLERDLATLAEGVELIPCIASITDSTRLRSIFRRYRPDVVFHAAAHKHVPMMEANPGEAVKNNVLGTRTLVDEAIHAGVEAFVMISTDKAVNPTSVMGTTKRLAEMYVQSQSVGCATRLVTVRFGNVLGSNGSVVPLFREQIRQGGPITVTHPEMTRFFMTIPEASQLVLQAGALGKGGEIFVLDMGRPVRVLDLALDMIRLSGLTQDQIEIQYTGLRPGEKLHEELYDDREEQIATPHPKIFAALHRPGDKKHVRHQLDRLCDVVDLPSEAIIAAIREVVDEYRPSVTGTPLPAPGGFLGSPPSTDRSASKFELESGSDPSGLSVYPNHV